MAPLDAVAQDKDPNSGGRVPAAPTLFATLTFCRLHSKVSFATDAVCHSSRSDVMVQWYREWGVVSGGWRAGGVTRGRVHGLLFRRRGER